MSEHIIPKEQDDDNEQLRPNRLGQEKRKRMKYYLVDKPLNHQFPLPIEHESLMSVGN